MSVYETITRVDRGYLNNRSKDQLVDIVELYQKANIQLESRIEFLEKALDQATRLGDIKLSEQMDGTYMIVANDYDQVESVSDYPQLAKYLTTKAERQDKDKEEKEL